MRLHRVRLRNYRGVIDSTVEFATDGVTIIEGDNEVGKTCIPEALDLILTALDSSKSKQVRDVKPVHRDEGPEVELEATSGDYRFVYSKRWIRQPHTTLGISAPRHEQLTGREAHERVEAILAETLDADLWRALRIEQGAEVTLPLFDVPSLGRALDKAAGGDRSGGREDDLWERICAERERYWTPTGQQRTERRAAERSVQEARDAVAALEEQLAGIEADTEEVRRRLADRTRLVDGREHAAQREQELGEQWARLDKLRADVERLEAGHRAAVAERDRIDGDQQRRAGLLQDLEDRTGELATLVTEAERAAPVLAAVVARAAEAAEELHAAGEALGAAKNAQQQANDDREHHRRQIEVAQLSERRERVVDAQEALSAAEAHIESARVGDDLVSRIEQAHIAAVRAGAAADGAAASIEMTALSDVVLLIGDEEVMLAAGATSRVAVTDEAEFTVPGVVQVDVRAGLGSRDRAAELREADAAFDRLCAAGGVTSLDEARRAVERRKEAERSRAAAIATIKQDLRDLTLDVMAQKIEGLSGRIASYAAERPVDPLLPPGFEEAKSLASEADRLAAEREDAHARCRKAAEDAGDRLRQAQLDEAVLAERIGNARGAEGLAAEVLAGARQERPDADLRASLAAAQQAVDAAAEALQQARAALTAADPDSLQLLLENAHATAERAAADLRATDNRLTELRVSLQLRGEEGLHGELSEALSRYRQIERAYERTESRAQAAGLLYETFAEHRARARRRYVEPFKERIEQFGRIVFGPTFEIELDDDLRVARRTLDGVTLDVDQLSVGAREQIGVLSRLACAVIVSPDGGAPVVLDDALGWSDPTRLARMGAAIAAAGRECQVIVLTCTPGRYAQVGNAKAVSLPG